MSYAEIVFATVPAAPPARKNQRATSCPAPISAKVPYLAASRLIQSALSCVLRAGLAGRVFCRDVTETPTEPPWRAPDVSLIGWQPFRLTVPSRCEETPRGCEGVVDQASRVVEVRGQ